MGEIFQLEEWLLEQIIQEMFQEWDSQIYIIFYWLRGMQVNVNQLGVLPPNLHFFLMPLGHLQFLQLNTFASAQVVWLLELMTLHCWMSDQKLALLASSFKVGREWEKRHSWECQFLSIEYPLSLFLFLRLGASGDLQEQLESEKTNQNKAEKREKRRLLISSGLKGLAGLQGPAALVD